jgi:hypothetical protein
MVEADNNQRPLVTIGGQEVLLEAPGVPQPPPTGDITVAFEPLAVEPRGQFLSTGVQETDARPAAAGLLTLAVLAVLMAVFFRWRLRAARRER